MRRDFDPYKLWRQAASLDFPSILSHFPAYILFIVYPTLHLIIPTRDSIKHKIKKLFNSKIPKRDSEL